MSYTYEQERPALFTPEGQVTFLKVRDKVKLLLSQAGAFRLQEAGFCSWKEMACVDRMVELNELVEWKRVCWGQLRVFTSPEVHNR